MHACYTEEETAQNILVHGLLPDTQEETAQRAYRASCEKYRTFLLANFFFVLLV